MVDSENSADRKYYIDFVPTNSAQAIQKAVTHLYCCEDIVIKGKLGSGYFGSVFLVSHRPTKRLMAMKLANEASFHHREIELLGSLNHINVLRLYGSCLIGARFVCLTEYANGGSLAGLLAAKALSLSWSVRISLALDIACGLHHLHSHSLIHRDLTSQNILIRVHSRSNPDTTDNHSDSTFNFDYQTICNDTFQDRLTQSKLSDSESDAFVQGSKHTNGLSHQSCHSHNLCRRYSSRVSRQRSHQFSRIHSDDETNEFLPASSYSNEEYPTDIDKSDLNLAHLLSFSNQHTDELSCSSKPIIPFSYLQSIPLIEPQWKQLITNDLLVLNCLTRSEISVSPSSSLEFTALVADLGLCLDLKQDHSDTVSVVGNPFYAAPECLNRVAPYTFAADIFSYGLLMCELITRLHNDCSLIPRTPSFGLDQENLPVPPDCPTWFLQLAVDCCTLDHLLRPHILGIIDSIEKSKLDLSCHAKVHSQSPVPVQSSTTNGSHNIESPKAVLESPL
uniref:dual-specificity kinase n=3 Tax=Schistosoma mansoni TaxID=6183 RepID=A0A5K4F3C3_SCHMA